MKSAISFVLVIWTIIAAGCANLHTPITNQDKQKLLEKRFQGYWDARATNLKEAYQYELPYQRYINDFSLYKKLVVKTKKGTKAQIVKIEYPHLNIAIIQRRMIFGKKQSLRKDKWIYVDGQWYHRYYQSVLPPSNMEEAQFQ